MAKVKGQRSGRSVFFDIGNLVRIAGVLADMEELMKLADGVVGSKFERLNFVGDRA